MNTNMKLPALVAFGLLSFLIGCDEQAPTEEKPPPPAFALEDPKVQCEIKDIKPGLPASHTQILYVKSTYPGVDNKYWQGEITVSEQKNIEVGDTVVVYGVIHRNPESGEFDPEKVRYEVILLAREPQGENTDPLVYMSCTCDYLDKESYERLDTEVFATCPPCGNGGKP